MTNNQPKLRRYLIARHGETNYNKERRVQGTVDEPCTLTQDGISQVKSLGDYIAKRISGDVLDGDDKADNDIAPPITQTWCSPLTRCKQTYATISEVCSTYTNENESSTRSTLPTPTIHNNLHEIELCDWQQRLRLDIIKEEPNNWKVFKESPKLLTLKKDGKEFRPVVDCWDRGLECWHTIRSKAARDDEDGAIFIMAHGAIGQCMLLQALGLSIDSYGKSRRYSFDNCECIEVEWLDDECNDNEEKYSFSIRWRRVHPVPDEWKSTLSSQKMGCRLSSSR